MTNDNSLLSRRALYLHWSRSLSCWTTRSNWASRFSRSIWFSSNIAGAGEADRTGPDAGVPGNRYTKRSRYGRRVDVITPGGRDKAPATSGCNRGPPKRHLFPGRFDEFSLRPCSSHYSSARLRVIITTAIVSEQQPKPETFSTNYGGRFYGTSNLYSTTRPTAEYFTDRCCGRTSTNSFASQTRKSYSANTLEKHGSRGVRTNNRNGTIELERNGRPPEREFSFFDLIRS